MERPAIADYPRGTGLAERVIEDFEFVWMIRGSARFVAGLETPLVPGDLLLVPPGVRHGFRWDPASPSRHGYVHFGIADVGRDVEPRVRLTRMSGVDPLAGLCAYLLWIGRSHHVDWQVWARRALEFMVSLVESGPLPSVEVTPALTGPMHAAISHLQLQWAHLPLRRIGVDELAGHAHISRGYLNRLFHAEFSSSASVALEQARCSRAEALLTRTDLTIAAIAHQCGYADGGHFSHRFSRIYGMSPTSYRISANRAPSVVENPGLLRLSRLLWG